MHKLIFGLFMSIAVFFSATDCNAQLNAADSAYFQNIFWSSKYVDDSLYPGNFYHYPEMTSMYQHYLTMDTNFKFKTSDLDSINYLTIDDSLHLDTLRNYSFATYPQLLQQVDPIVYVPYTFMNKHSKAYAIRYTDSNLNSCRNAFLLVPGTGINASYDIVKGVGYHNTLCLMKDNCLNYGDVYTFMKPNEEARAIYWNGLKLGDYIVGYLVSQNTHYGINYLIEMIAMIKYLKMNYDKVFLMGLSEGGYSALLCTMFIEPDAALISGGYSINFDTYVVEKDILKARFDYLLDTFDRVKVKNRISNSTTNYLFTWGESDPVLTMDPEHDFHYTQNYFAGLNNCSYFYDLWGHTFPACPAIDTFISRIIDIPQAHFFITDSSLVDTLFTKVTFCRSGNYQFDLYKDTTLVNSYAQITDSISINLTDSGKYYITHIIDSSNIHGKCTDTVICTKHPVLANSLETDVQQKIQIRFNNPAIDVLKIGILSDDPQKISIIIYDLVGTQRFSQKNLQKEISLNVGTWPAGNYFIELTDEVRHSRSHFKVIKQ